MKKEKRAKNVSVNALEDVFKEHMQTPSIYRWNNLDIVVKPYLSLQELFTVVSNIFNTCVNKESGEYTPEVLDFAFRRFVVDAYTNVTMPTSAAKCYDLICLSGLSDFVLEVIDKKQTELINWIVSEKIRVAVDNYAIKLKKQSEDLYNTMYNMLGKMESVFGGVSADDIKSISDALASGQLNEDVLISAVKTIQKGD